MKKILVVRPDRIGDFVLSLPVFAALRAAYPAAKLTALVRESVVPVARACSWVDDVLVFSEAKYGGIFGIQALGREIKSRNYDAAITLQVNPIITAALVLSGVRPNIGPLSKWFSWISFKPGIRQRRSRVEKHEAEYGLDLLRPLGFEPKLVAPKIEASKEVLAWVDAQIATGDHKSGYVLIHPGMGGSAVNWSGANYKTLIRELGKRLIPVVLSFGPAEKNLVGEYAAEELPGAKFFVGDGSAQDLERLFGVISRARIVVAPSTGPLHLSAALGKPTVSFYPSILVQSAKRWGPWPASERHKVLSPVETVSVDEALRAVLNLFETSYGSIEKTY